MSEKGEERENLQRKGDTERRERQQKKERNLFNIYWRLKSVDQTNHDYNVGEFKIPYGNTNKSKRFFKDT